MQRQKKKARTNKVGLDEPLLGPDEEDIGDNHSLEDEQLTNGNKQSLIDPRSFLKETGLMEKQHISFGSSIDENIMMNTTMKNTNLSIEPSVNDD